MRIRSWVGGLVVVALALGLAMLAAPAAAQQSGGVNGRVLDEAGKPVADVVVVFSLTDTAITYTFKTNAKGEYFGVGMHYGIYSATATKGTLTAVLPSLHVPIGPATELKDMILKAGAPADMTAEQAAKLKTDLTAAFKNGQALSDAGKYDEAIAEFTKVISSIPKCPECYVSIGDIDQKKGDAVSAEAAYKKAIELAPTKPEAYAALAIMYNGQKKFDDATKMSEKANELSSASGGGDPVALFNQGVILWNQGKAAEAQVLFEKASQLNPKMADAFYFLGMTLVNQGKLADAKKPMDTYMSLAPTGAHADEVKSLLPLLK